MIKDEKKILRSKGSEFHSRGAAELKVLAPIVLNQVRDINYINISTFSNVCLLVVNKMRNIIMSNRIIYPNKKCIWNIDLENSSKIITDTITTKTHTQATSQLGNLTPTMMTFDSFLLHSNPRKKPTCRTDTRVGRLAEAPENTIWRNYCRQRTLCELFL